MSCFSDEIFQYTHSNKDAVSRPKSLQLGKLISDRTQYLQKNQKSKKV